MLQDPKEPLNLPHLTRRGRRAFAVAAVVIGTVVALFALIVAIGVRSDRAGRTHGVADLPAASSMPASPFVYSTLTDREWALLAKDPDQYTGRGFIVYGVVTQSDAATGQDHLLALTGGIPADQPTGYPTSTLFDGDATSFADLIEGDQFTAKVTVEGSTSYDTQDGGNTTVPRLHADSITLTTPAPGDRPNG